MTRFVLLSPSGDFDAKLRAAVAHGLRGTVQTIASDILPAGPTELFALLNQEQPEVLIIGPDVPYEEALRFAKVFDVQLPGLSLVLVSDVQPEAFLHAMRAGIRDIISPQADPAEIRVLLEAPVMQRLARTVPAERWAELRPLAEATARAAATGCRATYVESDCAFHRAVLALSGNEQLVRIADDLHRRAQWPSVAGPASRRRAALTANAAEHTALLDALINKEPPKVQSLVRDHFTSA